MEQLKLSGGFARSRMPSRVMCFQRCARGRYVGTLTQTDAGYTGHLLAPAHAVLPSGAHTGQLGFLHADHTKAFAMLALLVAKQAWDGALDFDATCLVDQDDAVKAEFERWVVGMICQIRARALFSLSDEETERKAAAERMRPAVAKERADLLVAKHLAENSGSGGLQ